MEQPRLRQVRAETRTVMMEWLRQVAQGNGGLLFLTGEWGAGRTTLMREAIAESPQLGLLPAEGACRGEQVEPVWMPIATLLEQLVQAFPGDPAVQPLQDQIEQWMRAPQSRFLPVQLVRTLRTLSRKQALLLCLDDFHRASEPLMHMIENWLFGIRYEPLGILITIATPYENSTLYGLIRRSTEQGIGRVIEIPPLSREEVHLLVGEWCPELVHTVGFTDSLWQRTRGNLLFTVEILRTLALSKKEDAPYEWERLLPEGLRMLMQGYVARLSPRERNLLHWLSCFEGGVPIATSEGERILLAQLTATPVRQALRTLDQLMGTGWLELQEGWLWWRHPLVRSAIYEAIPPKERTRMHRHIAELLESHAYASLPAETRWFHWMRAEPDPTVLEHLWSAHLQARYRSQARFRLELLDACLRVATQLGDTSRRLQLLVERPHLLFCLPDGLLEALSASQSAIAELTAHPEHDPQRDLWVQAHCAKAGQLAQLGRPKEAESELEAIRRMREWTPAQQSMLELSLAYVLACQGDLRYAYALHKAVWYRMQAEHEWWRRWLGTARYTLRFALACAEPEFAQTVLEQMSLIAQPMQTLPAWKELWHLMQGEKAFFDGHGAELLYHARSVRALDTAVEAGSAAYELWFFSHLYRDASEALYTAEQALSIVRQAVGFEQEAEWLFYKSLALIELERLHEAEETLTTARRLAQKMGNQLLRARCMLAQAQIVLLHSRPDQAETLLQAVQPIAEALSLPELETELYRLRSLSEAQRENWHPAALFAEHAVQSANSWGHALHRGLSLLQRALVRKQLGDVFASDWELAESILSEYGKPLWWRRAQPPSAESAAVASDGWALEVRLLGEVSLRFRERQMLPPQWVSPRTRALFAHLVLMQGRPVHTDTLCDSHFPHLPLERARVNLQTTISAVRRSLRTVFGEGVHAWIQHDRGLYRWTPTHSWVADAFEFERIAQEAFALNETETRAQRLDDALRYYRGDLCPEFAEEPWCQPDFQRLRTLYLECLLLRGQIASVQGNHREVVDYGERALQLDPCDEASARMLMRAYHALGRKTDVHQTYVRCQKALAEILGTAPSDPTRQLYQSLLDT